MSLTILVEPHPVLDAGVFLVRLEQPLDETQTPDEIARLADPSAATPFTRDDVTKTAVRDLLRHGGFKPAGRSKPASEYLAAAIVESRFPRINALVDACNVVSLHTGLPISLVDLDRLQPPLAIRIAPAGTTYTFNPSGQVIDASGLVCLYDAGGPSGTPVKDAQRSKTDGTTRAAIALIWGTHAIPELAARATRWYRELVESIPGARTEDVSLQAL